MKIKLDENLGRTCVELITAAGHDAATVSSQTMTGAAAARLIDACSRERRCLLTLDLDFANPLRFPPHSFSGIAVIRLPSKPTYEDLTIAVRTFVGALQQGDVNGKLWIVETGRIRIYRPEGDE